MAYDACSEQLRRLLLVRGTVKLSRECECHVMSPATITACLGCELEAKGRGNASTTCEKRLAMAKPMKVGGCIVKIDGDGRADVWHGKKGPCRRLLIW